MLTKTKRKEKYDFCLREGARNLGFVECIVLRIICDILFIETTTIFIKLWALETMSECMKREQ